MRRERARVLLVGCRKPGGDILLRRRALAERHVRALAGRGAAAGPPGVAALHCRGPARAAARQVPGAVAGAAAQPWPGAGLDVGWDRKHICIEIKLI